MRQAFEAAIAANPLDNSPKLIYADWLEERGCEEEAFVYRLAAMPGYEWPKILERRNGWPAGTIAIRDLPYDHDDLIRARNALARLYARREELTRKAARTRRESAWREAAERGDVQAILAHPQSRQAVLRGGITIYTRKRSAIAEAKAFLLAREQRREDRRSAEAARQGTPGRIHRLYIDTCRKRAILLARKYHQHTPLYRSKWGDVLYGRGGQETEDRERYSKDRNLQLFA